MGPGIACDCLFPASSAGRLLLLFLPPTPYIWNELHRVSAVEWSLHGMVDLPIRPAPLSTTRSLLPGEQLAGLAWQGTERRGRGNSGAPLGGAGEAIPLGWLPDSRASPTKAVRGKKGPTGCPQNPFLFCLLGLLEGTSKTPSGYRHWGIGGCVDGNSEVTSSAGGVEAPLGFGLSLRGS